MSNKQGGCPECGRSDNDQPVTYGSGPFAHPEPGAAADTVYAHVERTVHALLDEIEREAKEAHNAAGESARIKMLAEAVQALSSWPQFNPMNAHADYQRLAEYEVGKAIDAAVKRMEAEGKSR